MQNNIDNANDVYRCIFNFSQFKEYLEGIAGGNRSATTAVSIVRDIERFFHTVTPKRSKFYQQHLLSPKLLEQYYHFLQVTNNFKPTTNAEKLRRIKMAIRFILHNGTDQEIYIKGCRIIDTLSQWIHSLSKHISLQRQQHGIRVINELPTIAHPFNFLNDEEVSIRIQNTICSLKRSYEDTSYNKIKLLIAFAAALIIYENCQRSGVVTNLTSAEFENRQVASNGMIVVSCLNHKTGPQGMAQLVISKTTEQLLRNYYYLVRKKVIPDEGCDELFFLTVNGKRYQQVFRKIKEAARANGFTDILPPPPSKYRILMSTEAARTFNDCDLRKVSRHLSHSEQTSRKYYEFSDTKDATDAHQKIMLLSKQITIRQHQHNSGLFTNDSDTSTEET